MIKANNQRLAIAAFFLAIVLSYSSACCQALTEKEENLFNKYYDEAGELLMSYIMLDDVKAKSSATNKAKKDLRKSVELYSKAVQIYPESWQSYWLMGKAYQALYEIDRAYAAFGRAYSIVQDNPDVTNEYMMAAIELQKNVEAIMIGRKAVERFSRHVGLAANYSLALLLNGQVDEAYSMVQRAMELNPDDFVTKDLQKLIVEVKSGKRVRPRSYWELVFLQH